MVWEVVDLGELYSNRNYESELVKDLIRGCVGKLGDE